MRFRGFLGAANQDLGKLQAWEGNILVQLYPRILQNTHTLTAKLKFHTLERKIMFWDFEDDYNSIKGNWLIFSKKLCTNKMSFWFTICQTQFSISYYSTNCFQDFFRQKFVANEN